MKAISIHHKILLTFILAIIFLSHAVSGFTVIAYLHNSTMNGSGYVYTSGDGFNFTKAQEINITPITQLNYPSIGYNSFAMDIAQDGSIAYILTNKTKWSSTDGGLTWYSDAIDNVRPEGMKIHDSYGGIATIINMSNAGGSSELNTGLYFSDDSINTFSFLGSYLSNTGAYRYLSRYDEYVAYVVGGIATTSHVKISPTGVLTTLPQPPIGQSYAMAAGSNAKNIYVTTYYAGGGGFTSRLYVSTNYGVAWASAMSDFAIPWANGYRYIFTTPEGEKAIMASQALNIIKYTTDHFIGWWNYTRPTATLSTNNELFVSDDLNFIYTGNSTGIYLSTNHGYNWTKVINMTGYTFFYMAIAGSENVTYNDPGIPVVTQEENLFYSEHQCANSIISDYLCNHSIYINGSFYCNSDDLIPCPGGCIQLSLDLNTSEQFFYNPLKTCTVTQQTYLTGVNVDCSDLIYGVTQSWAEFVSFTILGLFNLAFCDLGYEYATIPTTYCNTSPIHDFIDSRPYDVFYSEGYCQNITCQSTCVNNTYSCLSDIARGKCNLQQTGCWGVEFLDYCEGTDVCQNGGCIPYDIVYPPAEDTGGLGDVLDFIGCRGASSGYKSMVWLILVAIAAIVSIGFAIALGLGGKIASFFGVFSITAVTIFAQIIGCIDPWVIILLFIICAAVVAIIIRNVFVSDGSSGGG